MIDPKLDKKLPSIAAMERKAARRVPKFAFDYLQGGIGNEACLTANRDALDQVSLSTRYILKNQIDPDFSTKFLGFSFTAPFAPSPLGLSGLIWPRAAEHIASAAKANQLAVGLSSFATSSIEEIAAIAGENLWFQLYCTQTPDIENDLMDRAEAAGCKVLIVTIDIPTVTRREYEITNGLSVPPRFDLLTLAHILSKPAWAIATIRSGIPRFRNLEKYVPNGANMHEAARFFSHVIDGHVTIARLEKIRKRWRGRLIVKGILSPQDASICKQLGVDALVVSNHGGRQLDAAQTAPQVLPVIRAEVGDAMPLIADGGVRCGLDIARLIACGADFVLLGRAMLYSVGAAGQPGPDHAIRVLKQELKQTMAQLGCAHLQQLRKRLI